MRRKTPLQEARDAVNKKQEQVAEEVGVDRTTIGRWERGESYPEIGDEREKYARAIGLTISELQALLSNMPRNGDESPTALKVALAIEQAATEIRAHELCVVYGLLQTPDYAGAIARSVGTAPTSDEYVERNIDQRRHRQKRVLEGHVELTVMQPEAALRSRLGDGQVMAEQLRHLVEMAQRPNITIQVVPFSAGQYEAQRIGIFSLNTLPWAAVPTVDLDAYGGIRLIDNAEEVRYFQAAFDQARRVALAPKTSIEFMEQLAEEWEQKT